jgi:hypothetical protein
MDGARTERGMGNTTRRGSSSRVPDLPRPASGAHTSRGSSGPNYGDGQAFGATGHGPPAAAWSGPGGGGGAASKNWQYRPVVSKRETLPPTQMRDPEPEVRLPLLNACTLRATSLAKPRLAAIRLYRTCSKQVFPT